MVHIANSSGSAGQLGIFDALSTVMVWGDALYDGPTTEGLSFADMNRARATYLASQGMGDFQVILAELNARQAVLEGSKEFTLWFQEDLGDQLQVLQILNWFHGRQDVKLSLVWAPQGAKADELGAFLAGRRTVRKEMLEAGSAVWQALCSPTPKLLLRHLKTSAPAIPHLSKALVRFLQEYPSKYNGLSRTERQILESLVAGPLTALQLYSASQDREELPFMGAEQFWLCLNRLAPLLEGFAPGDLHTPVAISPLGLDVISGKVDRVHRSGIDRWLGGVHLEGNSVSWRWDDSTKSLTASAN